MLNLDTVPIMGVFLYLYELEGIDSQDFKCPMNIFHDVLIKKFTDAQMIYNSG